MFKSLWYNIINFVNYLTKYGDGQKGVFIMKRFITIITSMSIALSVLSGSISACAVQSDIPYSERPTAVEVDKINAAIKTFSEDLKKSNNKEKVFDDYYALMDLAARNGDIHTMNFKELEKLDYGMETGYEREYLNKNYADAVSYGEDIKSAVKSALESQYADDFREYWGEERTARVEAAGNKEQIEENREKEKSFRDKYFELLNNGGTSLEFTKLLRDQIEYSNEKTKDTEFDNYLDWVYAEDNTGFTTNDVVDFADAVSDYNYYINKFRTYITAHSDNTYTGNYIEVENPLEKLSYVRKIDNKLGENYDYLVRNGLCFINNGENYRGSTSALFSYGDATIFISGSDVMHTLIHEFGHYQSFMDTEMTSEDMFFGYSYDADTQEINSQTFELISLGYYDEIYGEDAELRKINTLMGSMQNIMSISDLASFECMIYTQTASRENLSDEQLDNILRLNWGENWFVNCQHLFLSPGYYINYAITMFDALQIYDLYLKDSKAGLDKYYEACSYGKGAYTDITAKLGLTSAFDENAREVLENVTSDIFKKLYGVDYDTALNYFENGTYLGKVFPTTQRVSVNGSEPQTLFAYSSNGYNYIGVRDLAMLLNGTSAQFDVEYDAETATVNIISGKPYTPDGTETTVTAAVETAGQKAAGTYSLLRDGEQVNSGGMVYVNGHNYFRLRGLQENKVVDITVDYDETTDTVLINTP